MIRGARKGAGSIKNGITFIEGFKVIIDPDCPIMYQEFQNYKWKLDPNGKPMPFPAEHQQDHGIDALRYALEDDATNDTEYDGGVAYL
jgi:phage terminase large subunit